MTSSTSDPSAIYLEERWFTFNQALVISVLVGVPIVMITARWVYSVVAVAAAFAGMVVVAIVLFLSPHSVGFSHIRITTQGLALWWGQQRKLPAAELGAAYVIEEHEAGAAAAAARYRGIKIPAGRCSYLVGGREGPAVFVEQHLPDGRTVGWLLATRDPEAVIEALAEVRDGQRRE